MTAGRKINTSSHHWCTPQKYVDAVKRVLGDIELDPCSNSFSLVQAKHSYTLPQIDGLQSSWSYRTIFVNPPYGRDKERKTSIWNWLCKCVQAYTEHQSEVIALIPVATNTKHWKEFVWGKATSIAFLFDTRLPFIAEGNAKTKGAPMACAMIYWGSHPALFEEVFSFYGAIVHLDPQEHYYSYRTSLFLSQRNLNKQ